MIHILPVAVGEPSWVEDRCDDLSAPVCPAGYRLNDSGVFHLSRVIFYSCSLIWFVRQRHTPAAAPGVAGRAATRVPAVVAHAPAGSGQAE